jgi:hypothetical protein
LYLKTYYSLTQTNKETTMDQPFTEEIHKAFELYKKDKGFSSYYKMCEALEIQRATFSNWKKGRSVTITSFLWERLEPELQPYIYQVQNKNGLTIEEEAMNIINSFGDDIGYSVIHMANELVIRRKQDFTMPKNLKSLSGNNKTNFNKILQAVSELIADNPKEATTYTPLTFPPVQKVAAGNGIDVLPEFMGRQDMAIIEVSGESMEPKYFDGQELVMQRFFPSLQMGDKYMPHDIMQSTIPEGSIIAYELNGLGLAIKKVSYNIKANGSWHFELHALNKEWAKVNDFPKVIRMKDDFFIIGKIIGVHK